MRAALLVGIQASGPITSPRPHSSSLSRKDKQSLQRTKNTQLLHSSRQKATTSSALGEDYISLNILDEKDERSSTIGRSLSTLIFSLRLLRCPFALLPSAVLTSFWHMVTTNIIFCEDQSLSVSIQGLGFLAPNVFLSSSNLSEERKISLMNAIMSSRLSSLSVMSSISLLEGMGHLGVRLPSISHSHRSKLLAVISNVYDNQLTSHAACDLLRALSYLTRWSEIQSINSTKLLVQSILLNSSALSHDELSSVIGALGRLGVSFPTLFEILNGNFCFLSDFFSNSICTPKSFVMGLRGLAAMRFTFLIDFSTDFNLLKKSLSLFYEFEKTLRRICSSESYTVQSSSLLLLVLPTLGISYLYHVKEKEDREDSYHHRLSLSKSTQRVLLNGIIASAESMDLQNLCNTLTGIRKLGVDVRNELELLECLIRVTEKVKMNPRSFVLIMKCFGSLFVTSGIISSKGVVSSSMSAEVDAITPNVDPVQLNIIKLVNFTLSTFENLELNRYETVDFLKSLSLLQRSSNSFPCLDQKLKTYILDRVFTFTDFEKNHVQENIGLISLLILLGNLHFTSHDFHVRSTESLLQLIIDDIQRVANVQSIRIAIKMITKYLSLLKKLKFSYVSHEDMFYDLILAIGNVLEYPMSSMYEQKRYRNSNFINCDLSGEIIGLFETLVELGVVWNLRVSENLSTSVLCKLILNCI